MVKRLIWAAAATVAACLMLFGLSTGTVSARSSITQFISPSGNIACVISNFGDGSDSARCDIKHKNWKMPRPAHCQLDYGDSAEVGVDGRAGVTCHGDTTFGTKTKLGYGRSVSLGRFKCTSSTSGVTCTNTRNRHGFFISIQRYSLY